MHLHVCAHSHISSTHRKCAPVNTCVVGCAHSGLCLPRHSSLFCSSNILFLYWKTPSLCPSGCLPSAGLLHIFPEAGCNQGAILRRRALWKECKRLPRLAWYLVSWTSTTLLLALSSGSLSEQIPKVDPVSLQDFPTAWARATSDINGLQELSSMGWPNQASTQGLSAAFAFCLALPLSQAGGQASRVRGSCLSREVPILHHHILPAGAGYAMPDRAGPSCKIMPSLEHGLSWPPTVYWALFQVCSGW